MSDIYSFESTLDKNELWKKYGRLVRYEALKLHARLPASVELDDLIQVGAMALLKVVEYFDPRKGVKLSTYLIQRLHWAFMDELRKCDWVPRGVRDNARKVSAAIAKVEQSCGHEASEADVAGEMGISLREYQQILADTNSSQLCSLEELVENGGLDACPREPSTPLNETFRGKLTRLISDEVRRLPEREQLLLNLYYQQQLNMKEVGVLLGITETRVSQLHSQAIKRLRARLEICGWSTASAE